jgi:hypothetical protein
VDDLDLRRTLRAVWTGSAAPPGGPARDLITHILGGGAGSARPAGS